MTECERLIAEHRVPEGFFEQEERCGYVVSTEIKKVWAISIDLLQSLKAVCDKYNLSFFAIGGTAIGTVRHKGFIPWDDDIDVAMPREDYNKLLKIASAEFKDPYFLQTPKTDPHFYNRFFARLRNSNTTGISSYDKNMGCNNGIFIDIMPLDDYSDKLSCNLFAQKSRIQSAVAWNKYHFDKIQNPPMLRRIMKIMSKIILRGSVPDFWERHEKDCLKFNNRSYSKTGIQYSSFLGSIQKWIWDKDCFADVVYLPFEYIEMPMPVGYDKMLKTSFGDYMKFPPKEARGNFHSLEFCADIPYKNYCAEHEG